MLPPAAQAEVGGHESIGLLSLAVAVAVHANARGALAADQVLEPGHGLGASSHRPPARVLDWRSAGGPIALALSRGCRKRAARLAVGRDLDRLASDVDVGRSRRHSAHEVACKQFVDVVGRPAPETTTRGAQKGCRRGVGQ